MLHHLLWFSFASYFKKSLEERTQNEVAHYLVDELTDLFIVIAGVYQRWAYVVKHADPLSNFADMLNEEYLWSEETMRTKTVPQI